MEVVVDEGGGELGLETERERLWRLLTEEVLDASVTELCEAFGFTVEDAYKRGARAKSRWVPDSVSSVCMRCQGEFEKAMMGWKTSKHHCRFCGLLVCGKCTNTKIRLPSLGCFEKTNVCPECRECLKRSPKQPCPLLK